MRKSFGGNDVLCGLDLSVECGTTTVILGSSGSGKSVLVSMFVGLLAPDSGEVLVEGVDVAKFSSADEWHTIWLKTGFLFQGAALFDSMTVGENIGFPLKQHTKLGDAEIAERVAKVLSWIDLEGIEEKMPSELSGGMQKRVGLARTVVLEPQIVIYDEHDQRAGAPAAEGARGYVHRRHARRAVCLPRRQPGRDAR